MIEQLDGGLEPQKRPRTAKPTTTDVDRLRSMVDEINQQLAERRGEIQALHDEIDRFYREHKVP